MKVLKYDFKSIKKFLGFNLLLVLILQISGTFFQFPDTLGLGGDVSLEVYSNGIFTYTFIYFGFYLYSSYCSKEAIFIHLVPISKDKIFRRKLSVFFIWGFLFFTIQFSCRLIGNPRYFKGIEVLKIYGLHLLWVVVLILILALATLMANNNPEHHAPVETILLFGLIFLAIRFLLPVLSFGLETFSHLNIGKEITISTGNGLIGMPKKISYLSLFVTSGILYILVSKVLKRKSLY